MGLTTIQASGVIFFYGNEVTQEASEVIKAWMELPVLSLFYEGPSEFKVKIEEYFYKKGYLLGDGTPIYIFASKSKNGKIAWRIVYEGKDLDNFINPTFGFESLFQTLDDLFQSNSLPKKSIAYDPILNENYIIKDQIYPFVVKHRLKSYKVKVGKAFYAFSEGFHKLNNREIYVGKDLEINEESNMLRGIFGKFGDIYYDGNMVIGESFKIEFPEIPIYADSNVIISRNFWYENNILKQNEVPVLDVIGNIVLFSDGSISNLEKTWRYEYDSVPFDWYYDDGKIALAFLNGDVILFDLNKRRELFKAKIKDLTGVGFSGSKLYVKTIKEIIEYDIKTKRENNVMKNNKDFIIKDGSLHFVDGTVIRPRYKMVWTDGTLFHFDDLKLTSYINIVFGKDAYYIITNDGTWRIDK